MFQGKSSKLRARRGSAGSLVHKSFCAVRRPDSFFSTSSVEFRAQFVHRSDQGSDIFRMRELRDSVPEIENVTRSASEGFERSHNLPADDFGRG